MGIHRDGVRWNLPEEDIEERRIVFWNMQAADTFQANCFSRPNSIQGRYCDVQFPYDARLAESNGEERGYHTIKYQIAQLSAEYVVTSRTSMLTKQCLGPNTRPQHPDHGRCHGPAHADHRF